MVDVNQTRVGSFLTNVAQGFQRTPLDILIFFCIVIALLAVFFLYFVAQKQRAHRELARRSREVLRHFLGRLDLNAEETALLQRLAPYLNREESAHELLVNRHVFDACATRLCQSEEVSKALLDALRLKIGFRITQPEGVPASSEELPEGSPILLVFGSGTRSRGTLTAQGSATLLVKLDEGASPLAKDARPMLYFHNSAGIFSFPTRVTDVMTDAVRLEHSTKITHHQRRKYHRQEEFLPVFIRPASPDGVSRESFVLDLGGGGASIQDSLGLSKKGDLLEVSFSPKMGKLTVAARVLRVSKKGTVINVKFESLSETEHSRIIDFLAGSKRRAIRSRQDRHHT